MSTATEDSIKELSIEAGDEDLTPNPNGEDRGDIVDLLLVEKVTRKPKDAEPEDEPEAKHEEPEPKAAKPMPTTIPKARFDEVNDRYQEMKAQNEQLLAALAAGKPVAVAPAQASEPESVDLDAMEDKYIAALLDGDTEAAKNVRKQIRAEETRQAVAEALQAQAQQTEQQAFAAEVKSIYTDYPELNGKGEAPNKAAIAEVVEWRDFLVASKGLPLHTALRQAAERVAGAYGLGKAEGEKPEARTDPRLEAARRANAKAALDQPPALEGGLGERAGRARQLNVATMTDAEFAALPEAEKKKLRGD